MPSARRGRGARVVHRRRTPRRAARVGRNAATTVPLPTPRRTRAATVRRARHDRATASGHAGCANEAGSGRLRASGPHRALPRRAMATGRLSATAGVVAFDGPGGGFACCTQRHPSNMTPWSRRVTSGKRSSGATSPGRGPTAGPPASPSNASSRIGAARDVRQRTMRRQGRRSRGRRTGRRGYARDPTRRRTGHRPAVRPTGSRGSSGCSLDEQTCADDAMSRRPACAHRVQPAAQRCSRRHSAGTRERGHAPAAGTAVTSTPAISVSSPVGRPNRVASRPRRGAAGRQWTVPH